MLRNLRTGVASTLSLATWFSSILPYIRGENNVYRGTLRGGGAEMQIRRPSTRLRRAIEGEIRNGIVLDAFPSD